MKTLRVYTDGSYNPGTSRMGWAAVIEGASDTLMTLGKSGGDSAEAEVRAVEMAMRHIAMMVELDGSHFDEVTIVSDNEYCVKQLNGEYNGSAHAGLWTNIRRFKEAIGNVKGVWVKAHAGETWNEMVDEAAQKESRKVSQEREEPKLNFWDELQKAKEDKFEWNNFGILTKVTAHRTDGMLYIENATREKRKMSTKKYKNWRSVEMKAKALIGQPVRVRTSKTTGDWKSDVWFSDIEAQ